MAHRSENTISALWLTDCCFSSRKSHRPPAFGLEIQLAAIHAATHNTCRLRNDGRNQNEQGLLHTLGSALLLLSALPFRQDTHPFTDCACNRSHLHNPKI